MLTKANISQAIDRLPEDTTAAIALERLQFLAQADATLEHSTPPRRLSHFDALERQHASMKEQLAQAAAFLCDVRYRLMVVVICLALALAGMMLWSPVQRVILPEIMALYPVTMAMLMVFMGEIFRGQANTLLQFLNVVAVFIFDCSSIAIGICFLCVATGLPVGEHPWFEWSSLAYLSSMGLTFVFFANLRADRHRRANRS